MLIKLFAITFMGLLVSSAAHAGHETGHGGISVVCRNNDSQLSIKTAELLDLWEGLQPQGLGLTIERSTVPVDQQLEKALSRLARGNGAFADQVRIALSQVHRDQVVYRDGPLPASNDVDPILMPPSSDRCFLEQLGLYRDDDRELKELLINGEIYDDLLSPTDRAAFFLHEAVFAVFRKSFALYEWLDLPSRKKSSIAATSRAARAVVATAFSETELEPRVTSFLPGELRCSGPYFEFAVRRDALEFFRIGPPVLSRTLAPLIPTENYLTKKAPLSSRLSLLDSGAFVSIRKTAAPLEFIVHARGPRTEFVAEKVVCNQIH